MVSISEELTYHKALLTKRKLRSLWTWVTEEILWNCTLYYMETEVIIQFYHNVFYSFSWVKPAKNLISRILIMLKRYSCMENVLRCLFHQAVFAILTLKKRLSWWEILLQGEGFFFTLKFEMLKFATQKRRGKSWRRNG